MIRFKHISIIATTTAAAITITTTQVLIHLSQLGYNSNLIYLKDFKIATVIIKGNKLKAR